MELEKLYEQLSELESKEIFCIEAGLSDKLILIREEMKPIKKQINKQINKLEGCTVYEI